MIIILDHIWTQNFRNTQKVFILFVLIFYFFNNKLFLSIGVNTQLQFTFEAVSVSSKFPCGCKTTYRAFSCDDVVELIQDPTSISGLAAVNTKVTSYPNNKITDDRLNSGIQDGMYILNCPPSDSTFVPVSFPKGSRTEYENLLLKVNKCWGTTAPETVQEWYNFEPTALIPESDSVETYLNKHPTAFYIPLLEELFNKTMAVDEMEVNETNRNSTKVLINELPVAIAQPVVAWSNRGEKANDAQVARTLSAPSGSMPNLEAAMAQHNKTIERKKRQPKEKTAVETLTELFNGYTKNGENGTFLEYADKVNKEKKTVQSKFKKIKQKPTKTLIMQAIAVDDVDTNYIIDDNNNSNNTIISENIIEATVLQNITGNGNNAIVIETAVQNCNDGDKQTEKRRQKKVSHK
jgi:hypothetical protein